MPRQAKQVCSRVGFALLAMQVGTGVMAFLLVRLAESFWPRMFYSSVALMTLNDLAIYAGGLPLLLLVLRGLPGGPENPRPPETLSLGRLCKISIFSFGVAFTLAALVGLASMPVGATRALEAVGGESLPMGILLVAVVPALGEELVFRHLLYQKLRGSGDKIYILLSGLCFGLFHGNFAQFVTASAAGFILGWVYAKTRRLRYTMLLHFVNNLVALLGTATTSEVAEALFALFVLVAIVAAWVLFFRGRRAVLAGLTPPWEAGWPYKPSRYAPPFAPPLYSQGEYYEKYIPTPLAFPPALPGAAAVPLALRAAFLPPGPLALPGGPSTPQPARQQGGVLPPHVPPPTAGLVKTLFLNPGLVCFILATVGTAVYAAL